MVANSRLRGGLLLALGALTVLAAFPQGVDAAPYTVWTCADGSGKRQPAADWRPVRIENVLGRFLSSCGDSAARPTPRLEAEVVYSQSNRPTMSGVGWSVDAAPGTLITGLDVWMMAVAFTASFMMTQVEIDAPDRIYALDQPSRDEGRFFGNGWADGPGTEASAYSEANHQTYRGLSTSKVNLMAWCLTSCQSLNVEGNGMSGSRFELYRAMTVVDDPTPPVGTASGLPDAVRISTPTRVQASASDIGSGVRELSLRVDGRVVARDTPTGGCADIDGDNGNPYEYNRMKPCPSERSAELTLSPSELADGARHAVTVVATDGAGQDTVLKTAWAALAAPRGFFAGGRFFNPDLDASTERRLNGVNAGPAHMQLSFVVRRGRRQRLAARRVVGASERPLIRGVLKSTFGRPIVGARVWTAVAVSKGLWQITGSPMTTSATGRVTGRLPARIPSREVRLVYFPYSDTSENVQSATRRLAVRAATTINTDQGGYSNGDTLRFSGRITTRPAARRQPVYLQTIVRGGWRTFGTTRANSRGRWTMRYRFTATHQLTAYRFRAVVPASDRPVSWATGRSRSLRVLVSP